MYEETCPCGAQVVSPHPETLMRFEDIHKPCRDAHVRNMDAETARLRT